MGSAMAIDLTEFERKVKLRRLRADDFDRVVELQLKCFPGMKPWTQEQFESQILTFPEGQICVEMEGRIVASSSSLMLDYSDYTDWHDWLEIADKGFIQNHDPEGDTLYGIEIMVDPELRGYRLARRLYDARKDLCRQKNLARMMLGGRIPGYARLKDEMSAQDYVRKVIAKDLYDPVLTTQLANGFLLRQLIPDYMPSDEDSAGWATCLEWPNLEYLVEPTRRVTRRSVESVRMAVVQYPMRSIQSFEQFAQQCEFFVDVAGDSRSDFVVFPELFTLQLLSLVAETQPGRAARQLAELTPRYLELFGRLAVRYNVNIIGGSQFTVEDGNLYNVAYLFRRDGTLGKQYKLHITPNEKRWWGVKGGDRLEVFDTDRGKIAILICYDVEFPELCRVAADRGALLLFVPYNTNDRYGHLRVRYCSQARCIENQIYVVTSGCVGNLPQVENADIHYAQSGIFTPSDIPFARDGIANETSPNLDTVLVDDLDLELLRRARRLGSVRNWHDRRTDLYRVHWAETGNAREV